MTIHRYGVATSDRWAIWRRIQEWADFLVVNAMFVRGELPAAPYHLGPLEADSVPLVAKLLAMHDRGLLTENGQGAVRDASVEQRSYVAFFAQRTDAARAALDALLARADVATLACDCSGGVRAQRPRAAETFKNVPEGFPVTRVKRGGRWMAATWAHTDDALPQDFARFPNLMRLLVDTYHVTVACKAWGEGSAEQVVLDTWP